MIRFPMRFLLFSLMVCAGCASDYKSLRPVSVNQSCIEKLRPRGLSTSWFDASIEVVGKHISGLLLIKNMPDSSNRIVFTNEAGITFLDFEFKSNGDFKVFHVIKQLNKKPVIRLLQKDFALMLGIPFKTGSFISWENNGEIFYGISQKNETYYFITDQDCASLHRIEAASKRKRKTSLVFNGKDKQQPDSILLQHHTFAMQINLRKIAKD